MVLIVASFSGQPTRITMRGFSFAVSVLISVSTMAASIEWEKIGPPTQFGITDLASGNGVIVGVAAYDVIVSRDGGVTWKKVISNPTRQYTGVEFGNGRFFVLGLGTESLT